MLHASWSTAYRSPFRHYSPGQWPSFPRCCGIQSPYGLLRLVLSSDLPSPCVRHPPSETNSAAEGANGPKTSSVTEKLTGVAHATNKWRRLQTTSKARAVRTQAQTRDCPLLSFISTSLASIAHKALVECLSWSACGQPFGASLKRIRGMQSSPCLERADWDHGQQAPNWVAFQTSALQSGRLLACRPAGVPFRSPRRPILITPERCDRAMGERHRSMTQV